MRLTFIIAALLVALFCVTSVFASGTENTSTGECSPQDAQNGLCGATVLTASSLQPGEDATVVNGKCQYSCKSLNNKLYQVCSCANNQHFFGTPRDNKCVSLSEASPADVRFARAQCSNCACPAEETLLEAVLDSIMGGVQETINKILGGLFKR